MKNLILALFLSFPLLVHGDVNTKGMQIHAPAPLTDIVISDLNGKQINLEELHGNVILLHFWATWCSHCAGGMKSLNELQKSLKNEKIIIIPVSQDFKGSEVVKEFYSRNKLNKLTAFIDPNNVLFKRLGIRSLPTTIILDSKGMHVATVRANVNWTNSEYRDFLKSHIYAVESENQKYAEIIEQQKFLDDKTPVTIIPDDAQTQVIIK